MANLHNVTYINLFSCGACVRASVGVFVVCGCARVRALVVVSRQPCGLQYRQSVAMVTSQISTRRRRRRCCRLTGLLSRFTSAVALISPWRRSKVWHRVSLHFFICLVSCVV